MKKQSVNVRIFLTISILIVTILSYFNNANVENEWKILGISYFSWIYTILASIQIISLYIFLKNKKSTQNENNEKNN